MMGEVIFPVVMLAVTLVGGSLLLFVLQRRKPERASGREIPLYHGWDGACLCAHPPDQH